jgi:hypothetical protein
VERRIKSPPTFCWCEALASLMHSHLGSFLQPEDIISMSLGAIWSFSEAEWLMGHKEPAI